MERFSDCEGVFCITHMSTASLSWSAISSKGRWEWPEVLVMLNEYRQIVLFVINGDIGLENVKATVQMTDKLCRSWSASKT